MRDRTMTEELEQLLKNLKLRRILEIYDEQLRAADKDDISYSEFVTRLVRAQFQARQEGALEWRIQRANLPERWTLETFPFARQPGVNRKQIRGFAELEFIAKSENIVLVGDTGRGKTGLACGLLLKALENGYRCQFVKAQDLFDEIGRGTRLNSSHVSISYAVFCLKKKNKIKTTITKYATTSTIYFLHNLTDLMTTDH